MKRLLAYLFIVLGFGLMFNVSAEAGIITYEPKANQIILINSNTNQILYEKNSNQKINPGSFTKIMTSIIVFDAIKKGQISLKDKLPVSEKAWKISASGYSSMFIMVGDQISVENLLRGLIVVSGNDAAIVLAEGLAGSENNFVKLMNDKAKEIGLNYTKFGNSTGIIIPTNTTTVKDVAIMSSYLINNYPELYYFFGEKQFTWDRTGGDPITQGNRNPLLYKNMNVDGLRTSYNQTDRYGLASSMYLKNNDDRLIVVGSGFKDKNARSKGSAQLLTLGKTNYHTFKIAKKEPSQTQKVAKLNDIDIANTAWILDSRLFVLFLKNGKCRINERGLDIIIKNISYEGTWERYCKYEKHLDNRVELKLGNETNPTKYNLAFFENKFIGSKAKFGLNVFKEVLNGKKPKGIYVQGVKKELTATQIAKIEPSQTQKAVSNKDIDTNEWFRWVESYPSALKNGTWLSQSKNKGISIIKEINLDSEVYVPDSLNEHFKYFNAVREQTNYEKYKGNKYKVLAAARNYFAGLMLAAGYHEDLKTAATLALKNCKKQEGGTYPLTECVIVMIGDDKVTYKEQGYWSEVLLKKPTLIKKYYDTINKNKFDQNYLAKNFLNDQKVKFNISNKKIVKNNSQEEFKPKKTNQDNEAPVIEIAEAITVNDSSYEFTGKVTDKAKTIYVEVDGRLVDVNKKGQFVVKGYSPIDKEISITAFDQWDNRSEPKIVKLTIDIKDTNVAEKLEPLNPSKIRSKSSNNKIALIIGIENYSEAPKANYANLDAKYFFDYARKAFGVKKQNINLLVNEEATVVKTDKALSLWLKSKIKKDKSELIIFFAGHGLASTDGKELYLLPQDGNPDRLERTAISRTDLFKEIISLSPKSVTMFLDTCYSGVSRDEQMLLASARPIRIVADEQEGIPDNFTIFSASQLDQISSGLKEANHGIFSYYLMKGMEGNADINKDKKITNGELLAYMDENVSQKASELGRQQNPSLAGDPDKILMSYR